MDSVDYEGRLSPVYHQGRALPRDGMAAWMRALSRARMGQAMPPLAREITRR
jgi:hypothetical protein